MGEIKEAGYQDLRALMLAQWTHIVVRNGQDQVWPAPPDRHPITPTPEDGKLIYQLPLRGDQVQASETNHVTVDRSALYNAATGGEVVAVERFKEVEFQHPQDQLTITQNINVPGGSGMLNGTRRVSSAEGNTLLDTDWGLFLRVVSGGGLTIPQDVFDRAPIGSAFGVGRDSGSQSITIRFATPNIELYAPNQEPETGQTINILTGGATTAMFYKLTDTMLFAITTGPASATTP